MQTITGFDHALIVVSDLDDAISRVRRLGFRTTPTGFHSAHMGTANSTIVLREMTYFELISVVGATPANADMRRRLERGQGLFGYAVKTDDAGACARELADLGAAHGAVVDFSREVALPGGNRDASFSVANIASEKVLGMRTFACAHHTPDLVWRQDYLEQPNAVTGVAGVLGEVADVDEAHRAFRALFGDRVSRNRDGIAIDYGNLVLSLLSGAELRRRFGLEPVGEAALRVLQLRTRSIETTARALEDNEVPSVGAGDGALRVPPDEACGVLIEFVER